MHIIQHVEILDNIVGSIENKRLTYEPRRCFFNQLRSDKQVLREGLSADK